MKVVGARDDGIDDDGRWWVLDDGGGVPMTEVVGARDDSLSRVNEGDF
ncbi:hypothetical protein HanRHA438_Chr12g0559131 [Helianthus annuus]|uniref:Uncharacterized protein n=1 Tax=Helianthus annuus TaxID=4232 RepID=A0A9K3MWG3_HELAN|nr:hypothetical protein HanXRQr2_Chr12g0547741 [Helianthus annuus]KAJ0678735.1 hypothetical protein HanOQP8_Chr12g0451241 [Helianthus annuus]KAJ0863203.1 hypothetical protein HanPSC8_Chr12g0527221 [Helianthus annuus]KAJ0867089.1 hypothetical protein HanRHA438_Chr12g0559131 [Helianthus annuus]